MDLIAGKTNIRLIQGDITDQTTDAIVNAANSSLMGGGGVDGAVHRKGGPTILDECKKIRATEYPDGLPTGKAVITSGGKMKTRHVIHTVGPVWSGGHNNEEKVLRDAYRNSLITAASKRLKTIAFPSISTGAYGFPIELASRTALTAIKEFSEKKVALDEILVVLFSQKDLKIYEDASRQIFKVASF